MLALVWTCISLRSDVLWSNDTSFQLHIEASLIWEVALGLPNIHHLSWRSNNQLHHSVSVSNSNYTPASFSPNATSIGTSSYGGTRFSHCRLQRRNSPTTSKLLAIPSYRDHNYPLQANDHTTMVIWLKKQIKSTDSWDNILTWAEFIPFLLWQICCLLVFSDSVLSSLRCQLTEWSPRI